MCPHDVPFAKSASCKLNKPPSRLVPTCCVSLLCELELGTSYPLLGCEAEAWDNSENLECMGAGWKLRSQDYDQLGGGHLLAKSCSCLRQDAARQERKIAKWCNKIPATAWKITSPSWSSGPQVKSSEPPSDWKHTWKEISDLWVIAGEKEKACVRSSFPCQRALTDCPHWVTKIITSHSHQHGLCGWSFNVYFVLKFDLSISHPSNL